MTRITLSSAQENALTSLLLALEAANWSGLLDHIDSWAHPAITAAFVEAVESFDVPEDGEERHPLVALARAVMDPQSP